MKIFHILSSAFLFLFMPYPVNGQYLPILSANKTVHNIKIEPFDALIDGTITVRGDTIVNQTEYKKVFLKAEYRQESVVGFVRESTGHDRLWFLNSLDNQEHLIMDLALEVGDTFDTFYEADCSINGQGGGLAKVVEITNIEGRKTIILDRGFGGGFICDSLKFIEGVGPNSSFFFQTTGLDYDIYGIGYKLCRVYHDDTLSFPVLPELDLCGLPTSVDDANYPIEKFSIVPNPVNEEFDLTRNTTVPLPISPVFLSLFDLNGKRILQKVLDNTLINPINISHLPGGCYLYRISTKNTIVQTGKIIKK